jgi:hypothetical protein
VEHCAGSPATQGEEPKRLRDRPRPDEDAGVQPRHTVLVPAAVEGCPEFRVLPEQDEPFGGKKRVNAIHTHTIGSPLPFGAG